MEEKGAVGVDQILLRNPGSSSSPGSKHRSCTDELREIISEFKNGQLDARQAEMAFNYWQQRKDVQAYSEKRKVCFFYFLLMHSIVI